jgi:EAL and modified HD-GYP domain-containing signal transduction protein
MLDLASYARIDIGEHPPAALAARLKALHSPTRKTIASRVETIEAMKAARELGFDYFQGFYFARPVIIEGRKLDSSIHALIRIIGMINADADADKLEPAFKSEPALSINLLRLVNSVGMGLSARITSIRQAIAVLGRKQLLRWLQLLMFSRPGNHGGIAANPLMQWAAMRGCFMELLAGRCQPQDRILRDQAFLVGIMSLMPAALGLPMKEILEQIALAPDVNAALGKREGTLGLLLELTERYDDNDMEGAAAIFGHVGGHLTMQSLSLCLAEAIAWVRQLCEEVE